MSDKAPILLQRECRVLYKVRPTAKIAGEITGETLDAVLASARGLLSSGRVQLDLYMLYNGQPANEAAKVHAGRHEVRIASWEVFDTDLIYCPAGSRKLDPKHYNLAADAVAAGPLS